MLYRRSNFSFILLPLLCISPLVQVLGDLRVNVERGPFITAHIIRNFDGVDPARYHAAVRLQAESVPLNVARNSARAQVQPGAPQGKVLYSLELQHNGGIETQSSFFM